MARPYFSIIVVAYNAEMFIKDTIDSVLKQKFQDYEIIVKDACSKDKTLENIPKDDRIRIYSTKDKGIYDGMNEAIGYANGFYCTFLNCGDTFYDENVLTHMYDVSVQCDSSNTILYGNCYRGNVYVKQPSELTSFYLYRTPLNHQSMFFGTEMFSILGNYNIDLKIAADYEYTVRAFKADVNFVYCPETVCNYLGGGVSESEKGNLIKKNDYAYVHEKYFTAGEKRKFKLLLFLSMKNLRQKIVSDKSPAWMKKMYQKFVNRVNK